MEILIGIIVLYLVIGILYMLKKWEEHPERFLVVLAWPYYLWQDLMTI